MQTRPGWTRSRSLTSDSLQWAVPLGRARKRGSIPDAPTLASSASMTAEFQVIDLEIPPELAGSRLDSALARLLPQHSRTRIKGWIEDGAVLVGRQRSRPRDLVEAGARVRVQIAPSEPEGGIEAEAIQLSLAFEDRDVLVIDKPAGLVVHPGAGNPRHTLLNALLGFDPTLAQLPRAGLIHRLDKDTSGLLVIARNAEAQTSLARQLMARSMSRE